MNEGIKYRGKVFTTQEIDEIREIIATYREKGRTFISREICRRWRWIQLNGVLKDMTCRGLLLHLETKGLIELPPRKLNPPNNLFSNKRPPPVEIDQTPITNKLSDLKPIELFQVRLTPLDRLYNSLIEQYHYLKYSRSVGEHLKYIVFTKGRPIACLGWSSAPRHMGCRDRFIGWSPEVRKKNLYLIAYNTRFLILPKILS